MNAAKGSSAMTPARVLDAIEVLNWIDGNVSMPLMMDDPELPMDEFAARLEVMRVMASAREMMIKEAGKLIID